jgi:hypothetical protein
MGASISKNVSENITRSMATISTNIIQNTEISQNSKQIISVSNIEGDVVISGNTFTQEAKINMSSLMKALSSDEAQQEILQNLIQESKAEISGLNLFQFSQSRTNDSS